MDIISVFVAWMQAAPFAAIGTLVIVVAFGLALVSMAQVK